MKRKRRRKPRATHRAVRVRTATPEPEPQADSRIRALLERYCKLAGVERTELRVDHYELTLPQSERPFFRDRGSLRVAFSLDALEHDADAELAVLGSPFVSQLIEAIRARGARLSLGLIAPAAAADPKGVELTTPVRDGTVRRSTLHVAVHPVGRLLARVVLRAGAGVEEAVVESDVYDLSAGARVSDDVAAAFEALASGRVEPADPSVAAGAATAPPREPADLLRLLLGHLREKSAERVAARHAAAAEELALELARLDRYFDSILGEQTDSESLGTVTALAERRRTEEIRRSQVKAVVHPLQLIETAVLMQRAEWQLESAPPRKRSATFSAHRSLGVGSPWVLACPHCGRPPASLVICRHDHCACDACSSRCSVCEEDFCADHGIAQCRVDGRPACDEHVRVCPSCRLEHCTAHESVCAEDEHSACTACLGPCGSCGRVICNRHAEHSHAEAPKGSRRLCAACLRHCEGGSNEPVGVDEVLQCATCGKSVCTAHQAACAVDEQTHCSQHLRRTDQSRRLVCGRHVAACALEPAAIFASDEVGPCPICGKDACPRHRAPCGYCGRQVCTADLGPVESTTPRRETRRCSTCAQLSAVADPPEAAVTAALKALGGERPSSRRWRVARDRSHLVVELDLGLKRKTVFTVRHGDSVPESIVKHSLLGSKRRR